MSLKNLYSNKAIILELKASTKKQALAEIAQHLFKNKFIKDHKIFLQALTEREKQFSTGIGNQIAIPHAQSEVVQKDVVLIAKSTKGINWKSTDNKKVHVIFSIALNSKNKATQTSVLQELSHVMMNKTNIQNIIKAKTNAQVIKGATIVEISKTAIKTQKKHQKIIAITACPTGIAHTYMAAEILEKTAQEMNLDLKVEKQGRTIDDKLSQKDIDQADAIILAIDKGIEGMERFVGKKVLKIGTKQVIKNPKKVIKDAMDQKGKTIKAPLSQQSNAMEGGELSWSSFKHVYQNLMGGVSRMLPFIVAGGIILGIGFLLDSGITSGNFGVTRDISRWFSGLGKLGLGIFVPILGGYVAYSIVGQEGLMPGFIAGLIASGGGLLYGGSAEGWSNLWGGLTPGMPQDILKVGSGFIGAMVGGYIAAATVMIARKYIFFKVSKNFRGIVAIIAVPIFTTLLTGATMFCLQIPLVYIAYGIKQGLKELNKQKLFWLIGIVIGLMMAIDMGGPINKVAYTTGTSLIAQANAGSAEYQVMAIVMITGMVPPIAIAFSNLVFRKSAWTQNDINQSYSNWLLGAFFITEGAIPYAGKDPKRVIPSIMIASAVSGLIMGLLQVGVSAPHGGIFVFALLRSYLFDSTGVQIGMGILFAIGAIVAGMITGGTILGFWRRKDIKNGKLKLI